MAKTAADRAARQTCWTDAQWSAALAPHRARILVVMDGLGEASAYEVAELLGRSVSSLYRHLDALVEVGLLRKEVGRRGTRAHAVYARGPAMDVPMIDRRTGLGGSRLGMLAATSLAEAGGQAKRVGALLEGHRIGHGPVGQLSMHVDVTWLDAAERSRLLRVLEDALRIVRGGQRRREGDRLQVVLACFRDVSLRELRAALSARGSRNPRTQPAAPSGAARTRSQGRPTTRG